MRIFLLSSLSVLGFVINYGMRCLPFGIGVGLLLLQGLANAGTVRYVDVNSAGPAAPYTSWTTAARTIQDAIDVASAGDEILVTNGVYESGGRPMYGTVSNRIVINKPITVASVNGPGATVIRGVQVPNQSAMNTNGYLSVRCAYVTNNALLSGFTLTNGGVLTIANDSRDQSGAGAWCETNGVLSNCVVQGNVAYLAGGGVNQGVCVDCTIVSNSVRIWGGGGSGSVLRNCTIHGNQQSHPNIGGGGGMYSCLATNCVLTDNHAAGKDAGDGGGGAHSSSLDNCTLLRNSASWGGGGAYGGLLTDCIVNSNSAAQWGGGTYFSTVVNSTLTGNTSVSHGAGARLGSLSNCVVSFNTSQSIGGGTEESQVVNCRIMGNRGSNGGGAALGTLINCLVVSNIANNVGGGTYAAYCTNCTIVANSAFMGGGVWSGTLANSIVYFNNADASREYDELSVFEYCCTTPFPPSGAGNIAAPPSFIDESLADLHLKPDSPCINSGNNDFVVSATDVEGLPRIRGTTVDIGAYEFQNPTSVISYSWLQQYGLTTSGEADFEDADSDGMNNWQEWIADTNPTNATSVLRILGASRTNAETIVTWESVDTRNYSVERASRLLPSGTSFVTVATNVPGMAGVTSYTDTNSTSANFYRVSVMR
jgi:hypothetical protein